MELCLVLQVSVCWAYYYESPNCADANGAGCGCSNGQEVLSWWLQDALGVCSPSCNDPVGTECPTAPGVSATPTCNTAWGATTQGVCFLDCNTHSDCPAGAQCALPCTDCQSPHEVCVWVQSLYAPCSTYKDCVSCSSSGGICGWCDGGCYQGNPSDSCSGWWAYNTELGKPSNYCACASYSSCSSCTENAGDLSLTNECGWCDGTCSQGNPLGSCPGTSAWTSGECASNGEHASSPLPAHALSICDLLHEHLHPACSCASENKIDANVTCALDLAVPLLGAQPVGAIMEIRPCESPTTVTISLDYSGDSFDVGDVTFGGGDSGVGDLTSSGLSWQVSIPWTPLAVDADVYVTSWLDGSAASLTLDLALTICTAISNDVDCVAAIPYLGSYFKEGSFPIWLIQGTVDVTPVCTAKRSPSQPPSPRESPSSPASETMAPPPSPVVPPTPSNSPPDNRSTDVERESSRDSPMPDGPRKGSTDNGGVSSGSPLPLEAVIAIVLGGLAVLIILLIATLAVIRCQRNKVQLIREFDGEPRGGQKTVMKVDPKAVPKTGIETNIKPEKKVTRKKPTKLDRADDAFIDRRLRKLSHVEVAERLSSAIVQRGERFQTSNI